MADEACKDRRGAFRRSPLQLGTAVSQALSLVGVTEDRVAAWLGRPCGCKRRKRKLNELSDWAYTVLRGAPPTEAVAELDRMVAVKPPAASTTPSHPDRR